MNRWAGCFPVSLSIYEITLFAFRFLQQFLGGLAARGRGAKQLPGRLPREPRQSLPPVLWWLKHSFCIYMIPKAAISVKDSKSVKKVISRLPGREENAMGGMQIPPLQYPPTLFPLALLTAI